MNAETLAKARALDRAAAARHHAPTPAMIAKAQSMARRMPTPAMVAKAETIGRRAAAMRKGLPRNLPPGTVVMSTSSFLSQAEATRLAAGAR